MALVLIKISVSAGITWFLLLRGRKRGVAGPLLGMSCRIAKRCRLR